MWTVEIVRNLILDRLKNGIPNITSNFGGVLAETGAICFESANHENGVELDVSVNSEDGSFEVKYPVYWQDVTDQMTLGFLLLLLSSNSVIHYHG
jgi:hypothetical protein